MTGKGSAVRRRLGSLVVLAALMFGGVGWAAAVVRPLSDAPPGHADAVIQLGGVSVDAYQEARGYGEQGVTPVVELSDVQQALPGWSAQLCAPGYGFRVECFVPEPAETRGEARHIGDLVRERGWKSVYVIAADRSHVARARFIVSRCLPEGVDLKVGYRAEDRTLWERVRLWGYQTGAWGKALAELEC